MLTVTSPQDNHEPPDDDTRARRIVAYAILGLIGLAIVLIL